MTITPGTRLGAYTISAPLAAGGMGEVYPATDHNLGREVAIKVLPQAFAQDAERLARFEREARTLATLNHPNIAIVHALEKGALVMELVEGPTLADRIGARALKVRRQDARFYSGIARVRSGNSRPRTVGSDRERDRRTDPRCGAGRRRRVQGHSIRRASHR